MSTLVGNLVSLLILGVSVMTAYTTSTEVGAATFAVVAYVACIALWIGDRVSAPSQWPMNPGFTAFESDVYRRFHTYLLAPGAANLLSNVLNGLRLAGLGWAAVALANGLIWQAVVLAGYFFVPSGLIVRLAPQHYVRRAAEKGNEAAADMLAALTALRDRGQRKPANVDAPAGRPPLEADPIGDESARVQTHAQFLFAIAMRTAREYLDFATRLELYRAPRSPIIAFLDDPEVVAIVLGYSLVMTAYRVSASSNAAVVTMMRFSLQGVFLKHARQHFDQLVNAASGIVGRDIKSEMRTESKAAVFELASHRVQMVEEKVAMAVSLWLEGSQKDALAEFHEALARALERSSTPAEREPIFAGIVSRLFASAQQSVRTLANPSR